MRRLTLTCTAFLIFISASPASAQQIKDAWKSVINNCGGSQIVGREVLFFGPSNTIGLGSVWRKTRNGGYNPRFELADLIADQQTREQIIKLGEKSKQCTGGRSTRWNLNLGLPFVGKIFGLTGIEADLRRARRATVTAENVALDVLKEVQFEQAIKALAAKNPNDPFLKDLLENPDRLLITKAYRITGLVVKLDYDPEYLKELKGKYPEGFSLNIGGDKGLKVGFNYGKESDLTVKLPTDAYIAGEFSRVTNGTINLNEGASKISIRFEPVRVNASAPIGQIEPPVRQN